MTGAKLPDEIQAVMENGIPAQVGTSSADGIPNATEISRVYYVDPHHVALSNQFFSKTVRNIRENPRACVNLNDVEGCTSWILHLEFDHSETKGPIFDELDMQIEAIASMTGMSGIFKLKAADIFRVTSVQKIEYGSRS
ncbi:MAG TPA: pyridoxamine 5'-phosphate oxidase family protein [Vicinamibacteria bacterium]|nr:pyridoxamine 5'-phosphate oxidase family protein [Vicinamibacteria bacterium]